MFQKAADLPVVYIAELNWKKAGIISPAKIWGVEKEQGRILTLKSRFDGRLEIIQQERAIVEGRYPSVDHIRDKGELFAEPTGTQRLAFMADQNLLIRGASTDFSISAGDAIICGNGGHVGNVSILKPTQYYPHLTVNAPNWGKLAA